MRSNFNRKSTSPQVHTQMWFMQPIDYATNYWIMQPKCSYFKVGGSGNFILSFRVGHSVLCQKGGVGHMFYIHHINKRPLPTPTLFDLTLRFHLEKSVHRVTTQYMMIYCYSCCCCCCYCCCCCCYGSDFLKPFLKIVNASPSKINL